MGRFINGLIAGGVIVFFLSRYYSNPSHDFGQDARTFGNSFFGVTDDSQSSSISNDSSLSDAYKKDVHIYSLLATEICDKNNFNKPDDVKKLFDSFEQYAVAADNRDARKLSAAHDVMCDDDIKTAAMNFLADKAKNATSKELGGFVDYNRVNDYTIEFTFRDGPDMNNVKVFLPFGMAAKGKDDICHLGVMTAIYSGEWKLAGERPDDNSYFLIDERAVYQIVQGIVEPAIISSVTDSSDPDQFYIGHLLEADDCFGVYEYGSDEVKPIEPGSELDIVYKATRVMNDALNKQVDPHTLNEAVETVYEYVNKIQENKYVNWLNNIRDVIEKMTNYSMGEKSEYYQLAMNSMQDVINTPARDIHLAVEGNKAKINRVKLNGGNAYYPFGINTENTEYGVAEGTSYYPLDKYDKKIKTYTYKRI